MKFMCGLLSGFVACFGFFVYIGYMCGRTKSKPNQTYHPSIQTQQAIKEHNKEIGFKNYI